MTVAERLRHRAAQRLMPLPFRTKYQSYSAASSAEDEVGPPTQRLVDLAIGAASRAREISLDAVVARRDDVPAYPQMWPGEHYRLLAGLVAEMDARRVVEIGTEGGRASLSLLEHMPPDGRVDTFDIVAWDRIPSTSLREDDFADGRLTQHVSDLSDLAEARRHGSLLREADLIFVDAAKDGRQEQRFIDNFRAVGLTQRPIVVFDDIRLWNMLRIWRELDMPKLDVTSFGHWSGTGFVDWR